MRIKKYLPLALSLVILTGCVYNPSVEKLNKSALQHMQSGNTDAAIDRLEAINDLDSKIEKNHYNLGVAYSEKEDYENSIKSFKKAIELNPKYTDAYYSLAVVQENYTIKISEDEKNLEDAAKVKKIIDLLKDSMKNYAKSLDGPNSGKPSEITDKLPELEAEIAKYNKIFAELYEKKVVENGTYNIDKKH